AGALVNLVGAAAANPAAAALASFLQQLGFGALPLLARGNADLEVEKVRSHEVGYAGIFAGKIFLTVDLYKSNMKNFVTDLLPGVNSGFTPYTLPSTVPAQVAPGLAFFLNQALGANRAGLTTVNGQPALVFSYTNAGEVDTQGGEIAINYYLTNHWLIDANYSLFDFDVKSSQVGDQLLPNAPETKFNLGLGWRSDRFDAKATYRWVDEFDWAAGIFVGHIPQYDLINVNANYKITDNLGFGVDVSNALDDEHWESFGGDLMSRRALGFVSVSW
ncbi:MAG TPA: TonB-dependent receptor, partial [Thermoanaerobaculia bacterium]